MSSYLQKVKNFSHCPLKKRPYHITSDTASSGEDLDEPQDLRVKRKKEKMEEIESEFVLPVEGTSSNKNQHRKVNSKFGEVDVKFSNEFSEPAECLSIFLQNSVAKNCFQIPPLTDFYLQFLQQSKGAQPFPPQQQQQVVLETWALNPLSSSWPSNKNQCPSPGTLLPLPLTSPSEEIRLSSPQSISSEDSGIGCDYGSEEEEGENATKEPLNVSEKNLCGSCGKSFSTDSGLRKHNELHCSSLIARKFSCKYCAKVYKSIGALKMHIRTHTLPCKCHICGKAFSRPWLLQGHIRTHTGEKPFECQQCQRSFADRSNLRAHQQTHERIKKYACHSCHKTFSRISLLNKHTENSCSKQLQDFQK